MLRLRDLALVLFCPNVRAAWAGFVYAWEVAEHFGVPAELVGVQARLSEDGVRW